MVSTAQWLPFLLADPYLQEGINGALRLPLCKLGESRSRLTTD